MTKIEFQNIHEFTNEEMEKITICKDTFAGKIISILTLQEKQERDLQEKSNLLAKLNFYKKG